MISLPSLSRIDPHIIEYGDEYNLIHHHHISLARRRRAIHWWPSSQCIPSSAEPSSPPNPRSPQDDTSGEHGGEVLRMVEAIWCVRSLKSALPFDILIHSQGDVIRVRVLHKTYIVLNSHEAATALLHKKSSKFSSRPSWQIFKWSVVILITSTLRVF